MQKDNSERPAHVQEFVGKYEEKNPIARRIVERFYSNLQSLLPDDIETVLEVGCGAGYSAERLTDMLPSVAFEGSDIGEDLITLAKERVPNASFSVESVYDLPREDNSVDLVIGLEMLEHLEDPLAALREMKRVSRKYLLLSVPREPLWCTLNLARLKYISSFGNTPGHINHWSKRAFMSFVRREATIIDTRSPIPWTQVLARVDS